MEPQATPKTKAVKAFTLVAGDKLLIKMDATHTAVREIIEIHPVANGRTNLYSITCEMGISITCSAQRKQLKVIE